MLKQLQLSRTAVGQWRALRMFDTRCALGPKSMVSLRAFDAALQRWRASGAYEALLKRYR